ncbi:hypothetical protein D9615_005940 [Tricholomella constricta]|uniref:3'-5' exonuclease n=1 Tax=Tricholomella constricta TaxID=117010 RepID=A0A8H5H8T4_9AGAR|nr:hypothetical protein D9615_005940 [Tricholomella constricta]
MTRPLGRKDGPRPPGAPRRGRPPKARDKQKENANDADDEYDIDDTFPAGFDWEELDRVEREASRAGASSPEPSGLSSSAAANTQELARSSSQTRDESSLNAAAASDRVTFEHLRAATKRSQTFPFFTRRNVQDLESDGEENSDGMESQNDGDLPSTDPDEVGRLKARAAWFDKPKTMPDWLYQYFGTTIAPLIFAKDIKDGRQLAKPPTFSEAPTHGQPPTFWVHQPEPVITLSRHRFFPPILYQPRVFLWLPHFYVEKLHCPNCSRGVLEKNGALKPRRITDVDSSFFIVAWAYYCRKGWAHFHGWSTRFLSSLPVYLRLAFPATLSRKGGLSRNVIAQLRVGNQHKMGPTGARSLLLEMHTLRFSVLQSQYLEAVFELVRGRQDQSDQIQSTLHNYMSEVFPSFGDFGDPQGYAGFVPSEFYLAQMMNKAIESDENDANQHTACLAPDQLAIDDSHKVNKHIAKVNGVSVFSALWTCMDSRYIRGQALTLTKAHEERVGPLRGIADSVKRYGFSDPPIVFSDDPVKDKQMIYTAFPSLAKNLTPVATAYGLKSISLPDTVKISILDTPELTESTLASIMAPLDLNSDAHLCVSLDAEWNLSRRVGVSVLQTAPHSEPDSIFIIPVHKFPRLPTSLLRLLILTQVFKVGSAIKGDITRLKKQFLELPDECSFSIIDLKEYCIQRGLVVRGAPASLDILVEKALKMYLPKDGTVRKSEEWEAKQLPPGHIQYAALDVYATRTVFEKEGGDVVAYRVISAVQPTSLGGVRVKIPSKSRLVVDIHTLLNPSAAAILHLLPRSSQSSTKPGCLTLGQLQAASSSSVFQMVVPLSLLSFDCRNHNVVTMTQPLSSSSISHSPPVDHNTVFIDPILLQESSQEPESHALDEEAIEDCLSFSEPEDTDSVELDILEAHFQSAEKARGKKRQRDSTPESEFLDLDPVAILQKLVNAPEPAMREEFTRIKKDLFHAFQMIPTSSDHWLRQRQGLALPALPPTTPEARKYFFSQVRHFAALASANGKSRINYELFAREWNQTADGKSRFYVTTDVLMAYAKTWDKSTNIRASKELITNKISVIDKTRNVFAAPDIPFPSFITTTATSTQPSQGVLDIDPTGDEPVSASLTVSLAQSHPVIHLPSPPPPPSPHSPHLEPHVHLQVRRDMSAPTVESVESSGTSTPSLIGLEDVSSVRFHLP